MQKLVDHGVGAAKESVKAISREAFHGTINFVNGASALLLSCIPGHDRAGIQGQELMPRLTAPRLPRWVENGASSLNFLITEIADAVGSDSDSASDSGSESEFDDTRSSASSRSSQPSSPAHSSSSSRAPSTLSSSSSYTRSWTSSPWWRCISCLRWILLLLLWPFLVLWKARHSWWGAHHRKRHHRHSSSGSSRGGLSVVSQSPARIYAARSLPNRLRCRTSVRGDRESIGDATISPAGEGSVSSHPSPPTSPHPMAGPGPFKRSSRRQFDRSSLGAGLSETCGRDETGESESDEAVGHGLHRSVTDEGIRDPTTGLTSCPSLSSSSSAAAPTASAPPSLAPSSCNSSLDNLNKQVVTAGSSLSHRQSLHRGEGGMHLNDFRRRGVLEDLQLGMEMSIERMFEVFRLVLLYTLSPWVAVQAILARLLAYKRTRRITGPGGGGSAPQPRPAPQADQLQQDVQLLQQQQEQHRRRAMQALLSTDARTCGDIVRDAGYPYESHKVVTEDGYVLTLERIPRRESPNVVLLQHGILDTSIGWVSNGVVGSQAFAAFDKGFDVFLGNFRGYVSREHTQAHISKHSYWRYSVNEHGTCDMKAMVQKIHELKIAELSQEEQSQGGEALFTEGMGREEEAPEADVLSSGGEEGGGRGGCTSSSGSSEVGMGGTKDEGLVRGETSEDEEASPMERGTRRPKGEEDVGAFEFDVEQLKSLVRGKEEGGDVVVARKQEQQQQEEGEEVEGTHEGGCVEREKHSLPSGEGEERGELTKGGMEENGLGETRDAGGTGDGQERPRVDPPSPLPAPASSFAAAPPSSFAAPSRAPAPYVLQVVAHSLGGAAVLIYIVTQRLRGEEHRISRLVLLSPAGFHERTPWLFDIILVFLRLLDPLLSRYMPALYIPSPALRLLFHKLAQDFQDLPAVRALLQVLISSVLLGGDGSDWVGALRQPHYNVKDMPGASYGVVKHLAQMKSTRRFQLFDYGSPQANIRAYGSPSPLDIASHYGVVDVPVDLVSGRRDRLIPPAMVATHFDRLRACGCTATLRQFEFAHLDFTFAHKQEVLEYVMGRLRLSAIRPVQKPRVGGVESRLGRRIRNRGVKIIPGRKGRRSKSASGWMAKEHEEESGQEEKWEEGDLGRKGRSSSIYRNGLRSRNGRDRGEPSSRDDKSLS